ncbi:MAG: hypothetical protein ABSG91_01905 [Syntrophobacteraceae bacterium]|jgi:hypothetical protein
MTEKIATLSFTPALSKRLIGQGLAAVPEVQQAYRHGRILLSSGSTTAHVYVALTGTWSGEALACGMIAGKGACVGRAMSAFLGERGHARFWFFENGQRIETDDLEGALERLGSGDMFIKGANALDADGGAGVLLGMESGGILGKALGYVQARGVTFLLPAGLEKMVYGSIAETARHMGTRLVDYTSGMPVGLLPVAGRRFCEIEALKTLAGVEVFHAASGGTVGGEGSVLLTVRGAEESVEKVITLYRELRADKRFEALKVEASLCAEHKWPPCAKRNILYAENVRQNT